MVEGFFKEQSNKQDKVVAVKTKTYNRKPYGKRGKYKKKGTDESDAVPRRLRTMRKSQGMASRAHASIDRMVDDLRLGLNERDAVAGAATADPTDVDTEADSGTEDMAEDDDSDQGVSESTGEDSGDDSHDGGPARNTRRRLAR